MSDLTEEYLLGVIEFGDNETEGPMARELIAARKRIADHESAIIEAVAAERERCAKIAESKVNYRGKLVPYAAAIAKDIRIGDSSKNILARTKIS